MNDIDDSDVPETGAVFTYGLSRFGENEPGKFWVRNDKPVQIACGEEYTVLIVESGRAFSFGKNEWGQLGIGNTTLQTKPSCIKSLKLLGEKARLVACGRYHTVIATESGSLYGMGSNGDRQLGLETESDIVPNPVLIQSDKDYAMVAAGGEMTAVLTASGEMFTWGANAEGQCGIGSTATDPVESPTRVSLPGKVTCISCGYYHSAAVLEDGRLFTWGEADGGKLGLGPDVTSSQDRPQEVRVPEPMRWVSCGNNHTLAVAASGRLYAWGEGPSGQLGLGEEYEQVSEPSPVVCGRGVRLKVADAGDSHSAAVADDGRLFTFGEARHGKLGVPGPGSDASAVWLPTEVRRFPDAGLQVTAAACGGSHTILLGYRGPQPPPSAPEEVSTAPQPQARRRHRRRGANGESNEAESERLSHSLPPLRRPSTRTDSANHEEGPSSRRNGEKVVSHWSDDEECADKSHKATFDSLLARSKFDNMLSLDDEEENIAPPPRRSFREEKPPARSTSPSFLDDKDRNSSASRSKSFGGTSRERRSLSSRRNDEEDDEEEAETKNGKRQKSMTPENEEMDEESTRGTRKRRSKAGVFGKKSYLLDEEDDEGIEKDEEDLPATETRRVSRPTQGPKSVEVSTAEEDPVPIGQSNGQSDASPDTKKVRVGCGGGGRSEDGNQKSKSCAIL